MTIISHCVVELLRVLVVLHCAGQAAGASQGQVIQDVLHQAIAKPQQVLTQNAHDSRLCLGIGSHDGVRLAKHTQVQLGNCVIVL